MKTFKDLINEFEKFAFGHTQINDYTYGNYQYNDDRLYVLLNIKPLTSVSDGNITSFVYDISLFDLLEQDFSNYLDVINSNNLIMNDFKIYFYDFIDENFSIEVNSNKTDNNLVQTKATIRFNLDSLYCSTAFCDSSIQTLKWGGISGDIQNQSDLMNYFNNTELLLSRNLSDNMYIDYNYSGDTITSIDYYLDSNKTLLKFRKELTYLNNHVIETTTTDYSSGRKIRIEIIYDINFKIINTNNYYE